MAGELGLEPTAQSRALQSAILRQEDIRTLTAYQLKRNGHKVVTAKDGKQALRTFGTSTFDVVLLDQEMPGMTGDEVARAIRKTEVGKKKCVFLVASTGNTTSEDARQLKQAGFDEVLGKPFRMEDLSLLLASSQASASETRTPSFLPAVPDAGIAALLERVGGDEKLLKRMIQIFLRDTPKRLAGIAAAIRRKSPDGVASIAHALKGSVSIFGAEEARKLSQELQELGRSCELSRAPEILASLKEEIAKLQANLRGYANQTPARSESNHNKRQRPSRNRGKRRR